VVSDPIGGVKALWQTARSNAAQRIEADTDAEESIVVDEFNRTGGESIIAIDSPVVETDLSSEPEVRNARVAARRAQEIQAGQQTWLPAEKDSREI
jgi:hypothetical protein